MPNRTQMSGRSWDRLLSGPSHSQRYDYYRTMHCVPVTNDDFLQRHSRRRSLCGVMVYPQSDNHFLSHMTQSGRTRCERCVESLALSLAEALPTTQIVVEGWITRRTATGTNRHIAINGSDGCLCGARGTRGSYLGFYEGSVGTSCTRCRNSRRARVTETLRLWMHRDLVRAGSAMHRTIRDQLLGNVMRQTFQVNLQYNSVQYSEAPGYVMSTSEWATPADQLYNTVDWQDSLLTQLDPWALTTTSSGTDRAARPIRAERTNTDGTPIPVCTRCSRADGVVTVNECADLYRRGHQTVELWCQSCAEYNAFVCTDCNTTASDRARSACSEHLARCNSCHGADLFYCEHCAINTCAPQNHRDCGRHRVNRWDYRPNLEFYGRDAGRNDQLFIGFELEMLSPHRNLRLATVRPELYAKSDGSIPGEGFELVSHPMTYSYFLNEFNLDWMRDLRDAGAEDHTRCGLHVHLSRSGFRSQFHVYKWAKLLTAIENRDQMLCVSRRVNNEYASFEDRQTPLQKAKGEYNERRYVAINCQNEATFEFRAARSTLDRRFFRGTIALLAASVEYTRNMSSRCVALGGLEWDAFATWLTDDRPEYAAAVTYLDLLQSRSRQRTQLLPQSATVLIEQFPIDQSVEA